MKWVANERCFFPLVNGFFASCTCCQILVLTSCWVSPTWLLLTLGQLALWTTVGLLHTFCLVPTVAWTVHEFTELRDVGPSFNLVIGSPWNGSLGLGNLWWDVETWSQARDGISFSSFQLFCGSVLSGRWRSHFKWRTRFVFLSF